jgi:hypothetical protein
MVEKLVETSGYVQNEPAPGQLMGYIPVPFDEVEQEFAGG